MDTFLEIKALNIPNLAYPSNGILSQLFKIRPELSKTEFYNI
jgi:hypothetical protein